MNFISSSFGIFMLIVFVLWWKTSYKVRIVILGLANIYFAALFGFKSLFYLAAIAAVGYIFGLIIHKTNSKTALFAGISCVVAPLLLFKYLPVYSADFSSLIAPVGISFYVFKSISYLVKIKKKAIKPQTKIIHYFNYIAFFPQLTSGPIQPIDEFLPYVKTHSHKFNRRLAYMGFCRICWGIFLKKCLADILTSYQGAMTQPEYYYGLSILWCALGYSLYLYFDFASYSQLSIGFANLLGIPVKENFISPYFSLSIGEFWRRWHISLSSFLREHIYIPLGGSKNGSLMLIISTLATFLISGMWHGATSGFILWGLLHGIYLICSRFTRTARDKIWHTFSIKKNHPLRIFSNWFWTLFFVCVAWFFFQCETLDKASYLLGYLFTPFDFSIQYVKESIMLLGFTNGVLLRLGIFAIAAFSVDWLSKDKGFGEWIIRKNIVFRTVFCYICIFCSLLYGYLGSVPNVYFAF